MTPSTRSLLLAGIVAPIIMGRGLHAQSAPPAPRPLEAIVDRLLASDPKVHQQAIADFDDLPDSQRDQIEKASQTVKDPLTRKLLEQRVADIDHIRALTPPLSLHARDATLTKIVPQLQSQLHARLRANPLSTNAHYTLDVDSLPFWEIISQLSAQHPVGFELRGGPTAPGLGLVDKRDSISPQSQRTLIEGPFLFFARWQASYPTQNGVPIPREDRNKMVLGFAPDPRLTVLEMHWAIDPLKDEKGHVLYQPGPTFIAPQMEHLGGEDTLEQTLQLYTPENAGEKIPVWRVRVQLVVSLSALELDIPDIAKDLGEVHTLGNTRITFTSFVTDPQIMLWGTSTALDANHLPYHIIELFNQQDERLLHRGNTEMVNYGANTTPNAPYRLHLTVPQRVKTYNLTFEIKDWPLPSN